MTIIIYLLDILMPGRNLLTPSFHYCSLQPLLPWGPPSTWTSYIDLIMYWTLCLPTPSPHRLWPDPTLPLLGPLTPSTIRGWGACTLSYRYLPFLEEFPTISALSSLPTRPLLEWPWVLHMELLTDTTVYSSSPIPQTLALMHRLKNYNLIHQLHHRSLHSENLHGCCL